MLTVCKQKIHFWLTNWCSCESVEVPETEKSRPEGDSNPQSSDSCRILNQLSYQDETFPAPTYISSDSGCIDIFVVKLRYEMLTVRGQQHSFSTYERMLLRKCIFLNHEYATWLNRICAMYVLLIVWLINSPSNNLILYLVLWDLPNSQKL